MRASEGPILLPLLFIIACGGSVSPGERLKEAEIAMQRQRYAEALERFETLLGEEGLPSDMEFKSLRGVARCSAIQGQVEKAMESFERLVERHKDRVDDKTYNLIATALYEGKKPLEAIDVLDRGIKRFPENKLLLDRIEYIREHADDPAVDEKLSSLGYLK